MFRGFSSSVFMEIFNKDSSSGLINHGIELQVPPTPQLVKRGVDLTYTGLWKQG